MNSLFFDQSSRLRSGWRAAFFTALYFTSVVVLMAIAGAGGLDSAGAGQMPVLIRSAVMLVPAIAIGLLCAKTFEGLGTDGIGVTPGLHAARNFAVGFAAGAVTLIAAVVPGLVTGGLSFRLNAVDPVSLLIALAVFAVAAAWEEAVFRGYVMQTLARSGYAWLAIALTAAFFGLGHAGNPAATAVSTLNTVLAGVWFGVAYLRTRDLWFVWAMHLAWNWMQGSIFGIEVSGLVTMSGTPLLGEIDSGPVWLTGMAYGIEGSVSTTVAIAGSAIAIYFAPGRKRGGRSGDLDLEADVDRPGRVGQASDRDQVHPRLGE